MILRITTLIILLFQPNFIFGQWSNKFKEFYAEKILRQLDEKFLIDSDSKLMFKNCIIETTETMYPNIDTLFAKASANSDNFEKKVFLSCISENASNFKKFYIKWTFLDKDKELGRQLLFKHVNRLMPDYSKVPLNIRHYFERRYMELSKIYYPLGLPLNFDESTRSAIIKRISSEIDEKIRTKKNN